MVTRSWILCKVLLDGEIPFPVRYDGLSGLADDKIDEFTRDNDDFDYLLTI